MENRLRAPILIAAVAVALILGIVLGGSGIAERIFGGPSPEAIATSSLQSMRAQNRLNVFVARFVSVTTARKSRFGLSTERTLILPGDVRYEIDLSKITEDDLDWDGGSNTLTVKIPEVEIAGPEVDLESAREYGSGGILATLTDAERELDEANRAKAVADLRQQAKAPTPMRLARESARSAVERSFALPLTAAGFRDVKVVARFPEEGGNDTSVWDMSTPYEQAIEEAHRRRAAEGKK